MDDLDKRIAEANEEFISEEEEEVIETPSSPVVDVYFEREKIQRDLNSNSFPRGSRELVNATVRDVVEGAGARSLARAYKEARDDSEYLKERGDKRRAQVVTNQYMEESFLPAVEVIINFTSPDELLNSKSALDTLDKYALGIGSMKGYTEAYVRNAYADSLGRVEQASSPIVEDAVAKVTGYLDTYQDMMAKAVAQRMVDKIKEGKCISSEPHYKFLLMVAKAKY